jgi:CDGSH-type Zn-finger protein
VTDTDQNPATDKKQIIIRPNGPYIVQGGIPLVHKTQVVSEFGEPLSWKKDGPVETGDEDYYLCRCGKSTKMPFCDRMHREIGFDGTETANTGRTPYSRETFRGTHLIVKNNLSLCMNSGFCGMRDTSLYQVVAASGDTKKRSLAIAMVERCPSGALTYQIEDEEAEIEPDLPQQIAVTTEITAAGPIQGPLWVTGYIEIVRSDGEPFVPRNRVTLCNCGLSHNKPLCDGTHRCETQPSDGQAEQVRSKQSGELRPG